MCSNLFFWQFDVLQMIFVLNLVQELQSIHLLIMKIILNLFLVLVVEKLGLKEWRNNDKNFVCFFSYDNI